MNIPFVIAPGGVCYKVIAKKFVTEWKWVIGRIVGDMRGRMTI